MNISRLFWSALLVCAPPCFAQEPKPVSDLPVVRMSPEDAARQHPAPLIKLRLRGVTVRDALREIERQTRIDIQPLASDPPTKFLDKTLSLDIETTSLKEAAQAVFEEAGVTATLLRSFGVGPWQVVEQRIEGEDAPQSGVGPFQVRVSRLSRSSSQELYFRRTLDRSQYQNFEINMELVSSPQFPSLSVADVQIARIEDDQGQSLKRKTPNPHRPDSFRAALNQLQSPAKGSRTLAHLDGKVTLLYTSKTESWEVPDALNAVGASHEFKTGTTPVRITVTKAQNHGGMISFEIEAFAPTAPVMGPKNPLMSIGELASMFRLVDANGQQLRSSGGSGGGGGTSYSVRVMFLAPEPTPKAGQAVAPTPKIALPVKLVLDAPTEQVQVEVPFSFSDLPLP